MKYITEHSPIIEKGFTTKQEYITWRAAWKAHYRELTKTIRTLKVLRKTPLNRFCPKPEFDAVVAEFPPLARVIAQELYTRMNHPHWIGASYQKQLLRAEATRLIELRHASKVEAQRQYLAAKDAVVR